MAQILKNWHLRCGECASTINFHGWDRDVPVVCGCGGIYEDTGGVLSRLRRAPTVTTTNKDDIQKDFVQTRWPEHLGG